MVKALQSHTKMRSAIAISVFLSILLSCLLYSPAYGVTRTQAIDATMTITLVKSDTPDVKPDPEPEVKPDPTPDVEEPTSPEVIDTPASEAKTTTAVAQEKKATKPIDILPETGDSLLIIAGISSILLALLCLFCLRALRPATVAKSQSHNKFTLSLPLRLMCILLASALVMAGIAFSQNKAQALDEVDLEESSSQVGASNNYGFSFMARAEVNENGDVEMSMVVGDNKTIHRITGVTVLTPADLIGWEAGMSDISILPTATYSNHWEKVSKIGSSLLAQLKVSEDSTIVINLTANVTYEMQEAFFADSKIDLNSNLLNVEMKSVKQVKNDAITLSLGTNPDPTKYDALNDKWHMFALLSKRVDGTVTDGMQTNDWLEFRIVHVGKHGSDDSALTFQAIHALPQRYQWDTSWQDGDQAPSWQNSSLRASMNSGEISSLLPSALKGEVLGVKKQSNSSAGTNPNGGAAQTTTDNFWVMSFTEFVSNASTKSRNWTDDAHDGSTYQFYEDKNLTLNDDPADASVYQRQLLKELGSDRSGNPVKDAAWGTSYMWSRSVAVTYVSGVMIMQSNGYINQNGGHHPSVRLCVVPCFSL